MLEGEMGTGKTAIACEIAKKSEFPFVKIISPETLVGYTVKREFNYRKLEKSAKSQRSSKMLIKVLYH